MISHVCGRIEVADIFATSNDLHTFRKFEVSWIYRNQQLQRLSEDRWTGHLATCEIILKILLKMVEILEAILKMTVIYWLKQMNIRQMKMKQMNMNYF